MVVSDERDRPAWQHTRTGEK